jgi:pimeloyl-ACP methyl ester carboxylesterase
VERERWISALAEGARRAGHSQAAARLVYGGLADVVFAYYGDLFERAQAQGLGAAGLDIEAAILLSEVLAEVVEAHRDESSGADQARLRHALAQLRPQGEEQGVGDIVRRAVNAATTLLGAGPWARAGQWAGGKLLVRDLAQVARYLVRGEPDGDMRTLDARIRGVVTEALGPGPTIIIAHSLGSVVAFEALHEYPGVVPLLVTLGSPLAMRAVVWPKVRPKPPVTPEKVLRWLNYWDRDDIIVARPILESDLTANTAGALPQSLRVDSDGVWVHAAAKYLAKAEVAGPIIEAIQLLGAAA